MSRPLTARERSFARNYVSFGSAKEAAIAIGVAEASAKQIGYRMTKRPRVREEIARLERMAVKQVNRALTKASLRPNAVATGDPRVDDEATAVLNRAWVIERLMRVAQIGLGEAPTNVTVIGTKGEDTRTEVAYAPHLSSATRALEVLGKEVERVEAQRPKPDDKNVLTPISIMVQTFLKKYRIEEPPPGWDPADEEEYAK
jgi:hypothetical protein